MNFEGQNPGGPEPGASSPMPELKYTLITGGSKGIGKALAREFAHRGMNLLLVARNQAGLDAASREITEEFAVPVHTLQADLSDPDGAFRIFDWCRKEGYRVNILVNNAGMEGSAEFENAGPEYITDMIQVNVASLVLLTRLFLPEMKTHSRAYLMNIGSLAGDFPIPFKSVYAASKAFVRCFSRALSLECKGSGVSITVVNPNGVPTNDDVRERIGKHSRMVKWLFIRDAEKIARKSVHGMLKGKTLVVPGFLNRILLLAYWIMPGGITDKLLFRVFQQEVRGKADP